jgi:hypothetical protein
MLLMAAILHRQLLSTAMLRDIGTDHTWRTMAHSPHRRLARSYHRNDVGARDEGTFAAQWLAYALPCQRFADALAGICA